METVKITVFLDVMPCSLVIVINVLEECAAATFGVTDGNSIFL
jgi:hypothetical protein